MFVGASIVITGLALFLESGPGRISGTDCRGIPETACGSCALGQFGYVTRGIVFALIGAFLIIAARKFNSGEAAGMSGASRALQHQPYGPYLLGLAGAGLCSYGSV